MKKIEIKVDQNSLEIYQKLNQEEKQRFEESVVHLLAAFDREELKTYEDLRNKMANEAKRKGITEDELEQILNLED
jgi:predicted HTH transcriptional regulator